MTASIEGDAAGEVASLAGRRVTVMGLGMFGGGLGAARWALGEGARVTVTDRKERGELEDAVATLEAVDAPHPVRWTLGRHEAEDFDRADVVIVNPAVPPTSPWIERARAAGAEVTTATALLLERCPARVVAVTGTQGKSSTATFCGQLLRGAAIDGRVGGNIGGSLLEGLGEETADTVRVLEVSSYQLEALTDSPPRVACAVAITNVLEDHLDRHGDVAGYAAAKARIVELCRADGRALLPHAGPLGSWEPENVAVDRHGPEEAWRVTESRVHLNGTTLDPEKDVVDDLLRQRSLTVERSEFEKTDLGRLPYRIRMTGTGPEGLFDALIYFKRRRPGRAYDFPFSIPDGFEQKTSL